MNPTSSTDLSLVQFDFNFDISEKALKKSGIVVKGDEVILPKSLATRTRDVIVKTAKAAGELIVGSSKPVVIENERLSRQTNTMVLSIMDAEASNFRENMRGIGSGPGIVSRTLSFVSTQLAPTSTLGARVGENLGIQHSALLTNTALDVYLLLFGPVGQSVFMAKMTKESLRFLWSRKMCNEVWRPLGIKLGMIVGNTIEQVAATTVKAIGDKMSSNTVTEPEFKNAFTKNAAGQYVNANGEVLTEEDIATLGIFLAKTQLVDEIVKSKRGEIRDIFNKAFKQRSDKKYVWLDGQFVRSKAGSQAENVKRLALGVDSPPNDDEQSVLMAAVKILESTNPIIKPNMKATVDKAFELIAYHTAQSEHETTADGTPFVTCEDGKRMNWNTGDLMDDMVQIGASPSGVTVEEVDSTTPISNSKQPIVEEVD